LNCCRVARLATNGFGLGAGEIIISTLLIPIAIGTDVSHFGGMKLKYFEHLQKQKRSAMQAINLALP